MTEAARRAFEEVLKLEPSRVEPRFWLALAKEQDGDLAGAAADYRNLLASAGGPAPWRESVRERLRAIGEQATKGAAEPPPSTGPAVTGPGPTAADVAATESMAPADKGRMIEGMVAGLAARLEVDGRNPEGWARLIQSYSVLGRKPDAIAALAKARRALAGDASELSQLAALAKRLGLEP